MVKLEKSEVLGRLTRKDDLSEQGITTWTLIKEAIREKRKNEVIELLSFLRKECWIDQVAFINKSLSYIAENHGEQEVEKALRWWRGVLQKAGDVIYSMSLEELIQYQCEEMRASLNLGGKDCFSVSEEKERFVISVDPTHMTRLRRATRNEPAKVLDVTQGSHPWSWGRAGVPYYCARCCLWWEIMPIEDRGYPVRVHEYPENPYDPCRIMYYKEPESIPREYFSRVGKEKDLSTFKS